MGEFGSKDRIEIGDEIPSMEIPSVHDYFSISTNKRHPKTLTWSHSEKF
ncbi:MAG: hypothetical protein ACLQDF_14890 [Desulfomonilia bacterium]